MRRAAQKLVELIARAAARRAFQTAAQRALRVKARGKDAAEPTEPQQAQAKGRRPC